MTAIKMIEMTIQPEAATGGVLERKVLLEISQNLQENTCARDSSLIKLQLLNSENTHFLKKSLCSTCKLFGLLIFIFTKIMSLL